MIRSFACPEIGMLFNSRAVPRFRNTTTNGASALFGKRVPTDEKREVGLDIKTVQFGWSIGMPMVIWLSNG